MISVDQAKEAAASYLESHALDLGKFLVRAGIAWIKNRRKAEASIANLHLEYEREMADIEAQMKGGTK